MECFKVNNNFVKLFIWTWTFCRWTDTNTTVLLLLFCLPLNQSNTIKQKQKLKQTLQKNIAANCSNFFIKKIQTDNICNSRQSCSKPSYTKPNHTQPNQLFHITWHWNLFGYCKKSYFQLVRHFNGLQSLLATLGQAYKELCLLMCLLFVCILTFARSVTSLNNILFWSASVDFWSWSTLTERVKDIDCSIQTF